MAKKKKPSLMERLREKRLQEIEAKEAKKGKPTKAYRVEVEIRGNTYGPFCAGIYDDKYEKICDKYRFSLKGCIKEPEEDGCDVFYQGMVCGVSEMWQLLHWFHPWILKDLMRAGFKVVEYEVKEAYKGETQTVWHPCHATMVHTYTYDEIVELMHTA